MLRREVDRAETFLVGAIEVDQKGAQTLVFGAIACVLLGMFIGAFLFAVVRSHTQAPPHRVEWCCHEGPGLGGVGCHRPDYQPERN